MDDIAVGQIQYASKELDHLWEKMSNMDLVHLLGILIDTEKDELYYGRLSDGDGNVIEEGIPIIDLQKKHEGVWGVRKILLSRGEVYFKRIECSKCDQPPSRRDENGEPICYWCRIEEKDPDQFKAWEDADKVPHRVKK